MGPTIKCKFVMLPHFTILFYDFRIAPGKTKHSMQSTSWLRIWEFIPKKSLIFARWVQSFFQVCNSKGNLSSQFNLSVLKKKIIFHDSNEVNVSFRFLVKRGSSSSYSRNHLSTRGHSEPEKSMIPTKSTK